MQVLVLIYFTVIYGWTYFERKINAASILFRERFAELFSQGLTLCDTYVTPPIERLLKILLHLKLDLYDKNYLQVNKDNNRVSNQYTLYDSSRFSDSDCGPSSVKTNAKTQTFICRLFLL